MVIASVPPIANPPKEAYDALLILDFGSQHLHPAPRKLRDIEVSLR